MSKYYLIPAKEGLGFIHVRAEKKPTGKTLKALQDLFAAAYQKAAESGAVKASGGNTTTQARRLRLQRSTRQRGPV